MHLAEFSQEKGDMMISLGVEAPQLTVPQRSEVERGLKAWQGRDGRCWLWIAPGYCPVLKKWAAKIQVEIVPVVKPPPGSVFDVEFGPKLREAAFPYYEWIRGNNYDFCEFGIDLESAFEGSVFWMEPPDRCRVAIESIALAFFGMGKGIAMYPSTNADPSNQLTMTKRVEAIASAWGGEFMLNSRCWKTKNKQWSDSYFNFYKGSNTAQLIYVALEDRPQSEIDAMTPEARESFLNWRDNGVPIDRLGKHIKAMQSDSRMQNAEIIIYPGYTNFGRRAGEIRAALDKAGL